MQVPSAMTTMPPEPRPEPAAATLAWSSVSGSMSAAVSTLVEMPPGMTHFRPRPPRTPPQSSRMNFADDAGDVGEGLDVVDDGRPLVEAAYGEARRPVARIALASFERRQQARRL